MHFRAILDTRHLLKKSAGQCSQGSSRKTLTGQCSTGCHKRLTQKLIFGKVEGSQLQQNWRLSIEKLLQSLNRTLFEATCDSSASCSVIPCYRLSTSRQPLSLSRIPKQREGSCQETSFKGCLLLHRRNSGRAQTWSISWCDSLAPTLPQIWHKFIRSPSRFWRAPLSGANWSRGPATTTAQSLWITHSHLMHGFVSPFAGSW